MINPITRYISRVFILMMLGIIAAALAGCADDPLYVDSDAEGDGTIMMSLNFEPMYEVDMATRTPGNAIHDIESLAIVFFDTDGNLVRIVNQGDPEIKDWSLNQNGNTSMPEGAPEDSQAEASTPRATFRLVNLNLPYGKYHIYAVANMGDLSSSEADPLTEQKLKSTILTWNPDNIAKNNQMFGYFTTVNSAGDQSAMPSGFGPQEIVLSDNTSPRLHSWMRRAASKVTVAFDASRLKDEVWIYVNKVTIRDIPRTCTLGMSNQPKSDADLISEGGSLYYNDNGVIPAAQTSTDHTQWLTLSNDDRLPVGSDHSSTAEALFFYENMQGDYSDLPEEQRKKYDKKQSGSPNLGVLVDPGDPDYKDEVPYGTWIEVEAFYESNNPENLGSGKIIYRFMLGKDVDYNYDAERNHHFKLTLVFNGWANQADWHIEYTQEDPAAIVPLDFYMPYLYNQKSMFPIKLNGNVQSLDVEIIENGWAPVSISTHNVPAQTVGDFTWNLQAYNEFGPVSDPYLGFLALAVPNETGEPATNVVAENTNRAAARQELKGLYEATYTAEGGYRWSQKSRQYNVAEGTHQVGNNEYTVTKADSGDSYTVQIPLWTRNKTMIEKSGYTGNNPYEAFERKAVIRITATFLTAQGTRTIIQEVPIYQTRRLVNPKGVWRSATDNDPFVVHLMTMNSPTDTKYTPLKSDGSWTAYIESGNADFCHLEDASGARSDIIRGTTGSEVEFKIVFDGKVTAGNSAGCIVAIHYNGGGCIHRVLVRQGYGEPVAIVNGGAKWLSFNLYACEAGHDGADYNTIIPAEVSCNPLSVGSLFKRRNYSQAILVSNNTTYGPLVALNDGNLSVKAKGGAESEETWANITPYPESTFNGSGNTSLSAVTATTSTSTRWARFTATASGTSTQRRYRVASYSDYQALDNAEYAVGVLYADGATGTLDTFDAYGYEDGTNTLSRSEKGMRGYIVYNISTGNQIFFPVGKYGMARRTQTWTSTAQRGYLRYAGWNQVLTGANNYWRPIPYDMPHCPGSIYWIENVMIGNNYHSDGGSGGWDMNYFSFDFGSYNYECVNDALPIKLVLDE